MRLAIILLFAASFCQAQTLVTVSDTIFNADGTKASGTVTVTWKPFTTADNRTIAGGQIIRTIGADGKLNISLAPNAGASPTGTSYTVNYALGRCSTANNSGGGCYSEYWVVPATGPVTIAAIRTTPTPTPNVKLGCAQLPSFTGDVTNVGCAMTIISSGGVWGGIAGTLSNQTDLQNALNLKANLLSPTITTPTLLIPVIASFASATHDHQNSDGGGALSTGAIASGAFAKARQNATTMYTDQANTTGAFLQNFSAGTLKLPVSAGATAATNGLIAYDSTAGMLHVAQGSADAFVAQSTATPANNDCVKWVVSGSQYKIGTAGAACGSGGGGGSWGGITGTLSNQTDLQNALDLKAALISPSFTTPTLGVATATSINKVAITAPASSATLTIANTKTLTVSNTLTFAGTDSTVMTFPSGSGTVLTADSTATLTGKSISGGQITSAVATATALAANPTDCSSSQFAYQIDAQGNLTCAAIGAADLSNGVTGSGAVVLATSATLVTPALGTPSAIILTNATGLPISGITGFGTGVATFLGTPSSANLAAALTDETGTGAAVFGTSPTIVTPTIASFTNATHTHQNAAGGGTLANAALTNSSITVNTTSPITGGAVVSLGGTITVACATCATSTPPGSTTQLIFNDAGAFGASSALTLTKTTGTVTQSDVTLAQTAMIANKLLPFDYPTSPGFYTGYGSFSSAGSTTPDNVWSQGWNKDTNGSCVDSNFPCLGLVYERMWYPQGSGAAAAATMTVNAAGSSYTAGDCMVVVQGGSNQNAIVCVVSLSGSGVATFATYQAGSAYAVASALATLPATFANSGVYGLQTGSGTGFKVNITTIGAPFDGGTETYFAYTPAKSGGLLQLRPFGILTNYATNYVQGNFAMDIFSFQDSTAQNTGVSITNTRNLANTGSLLISGSALAGYSLTNLGKTFLGGVTTTTAIINTAAPTTATASLNLPRGTAPTSPADGDLWGDLSNIINYRGGGPATYALVNTTSTQTLTNKSIAANQITAGSFNTGAYSFAGSSISAIGVSGTNFTANGVLTLPEANTTRAFLNLGTNGADPTSPNEGDLWIKLSGQVFSYYGGGAPWRVMAIRNPTYADGQLTYYSGGAGRWDVLAPNTTATPKALVMTSSTPAWNSNVAFQNSANTFSSSNEFTKDFTLSGSLSPTALSGDVNDYNPTNCATSTALRIDGGAADRNITGLQCAASAPADGRLVTITNTGATNSLVLKDQSSSSTGANRFLLPSDVTLAVNTAIALRYDGSTQRWRPLSRALANTGTAGTYQKVTTDIQGRVTSGTTLGSGDVPCAAMPALTGGVTNSAGSCATTAATLSAASLARTLVWQFYDGGPALTTASTALTYITAESTCTINAWSISADAGTATIKVWKIAAGTAIPTISNVINTSGVALSSGTHVRSTTVSDFTSTTITQGDILTVVLTAVATATKLTFQLGCATVQ